MYASIDGVLRMTAVLQHRHRFATPSRSGRPQTPASPRDITCCVVGFSRGNALGFWAENETALAPWGRGTVSLCDVTTNDARNSPKGWFRRTIGSKRNISF